ncbi:MAG: hypothetical protein IKU01_01615 [Bacteroidales bacterium]|nr:hypothetical protein [Bacteroidales bacterium]
MTIQEALNFSAIYPELASLKMPFDIALKLHKINLEATEASKFYQTKLEELISEYGERDENGELKTTDTGVSLKQETADECRKKLDELQATEWETFDLTFSEEQLEKLERFELTPVQIGAIYPFLS